MAAPSRTEQPDGKRDKTAGKFGAHAPQALLSPEEAAHRAAIHDKRKTRTQSLILKFLLAIIFVCLPHPVAAGICANNSCKIVKTPHNFYIRCKCGARFKRHCSEMGCDRGSSCATCCASGNASAVQRAEDTNWQQKQFQKFQERKPLVQQWRKLSQEIKSNFRNMESFIEHGLEEKRRAEAKTAEAKRRAEAKTAREQAAQLSSNDDSESSAESGEWKGTRPKACPCCKSNFDWKRNKMITCSSCNKTNIKGNCEYSRCRRNNRCNTCADGVSIPRSKHKSAKLGKVIN